MPQRNTKVPHKNAVIVRFHLDDKPRYIVKPTQNDMRPPRGVPPTEIRTLSRTRGGVLGEGVFHCKMNRFMDIRIWKGNGQPTRLRAHGPGGFSYLVFYFSLDLALYSAGYLVLDLAISGLI